MPTLPAVATFPRDDLVFRAFVRTSVRENPSLLREPAALQAFLRRWHTRASVHPQADLAGFGVAATWYVYRDGRAGIALGRDWWQADDVARVSFGRDGVFLTANDAADTLVGRGSVVGTHWSALLPAEATAETGDWLWDLLDTVGEAQSVFDLPLPDGRRRVIEYRTTRCPEPGTYESWWRELAVIEVGEPDASLAGARSAEAV